MTLRLIEPRIHSSSITNSHSDRESAAHLRTHDMFCGRIPARINVLSYRLRGQRSRNSELPRFSSLRAQFLPSCAIARRLRRKHEHSATSNAGIVSAHFFPRTVSSRWKSGYTEKVLFDFCYQPTCADGASPRAGLIFDDAGALYGTTVGGGTYDCNGGEAGCGIVFKLTPSGSGYAERVLYSFTGAPDGAFPYAGLILDDKGALYGTTGSGGKKNDGTVFKLTPSRSGYTESILYSFCHARHCSDGEDPDASLIFDKKGALYGTTDGGGSPAGDGTVFKLTPSGSGYTESVLYRFCKRSGCGDDSNPLAGLIFDKNGALYGTTEFGGGSYDCYYGKPGCGTVFKLTPSGSGYIESVLYRFSRKSPCRDGALPVAGLIFGKRVRSTARLRGAASLTAITRKNPRDVAQLK